MYLSQLIPVRGRKQGNPLDIGTAERVTTYPREGTETFTVSVIFLAFKVTTYPREGTETIFYIL